MWPRGRYTENAYQESFLKFFFLPVIKKYKPQFIFVFKVVVPSLCKILFQEPERKVYIDFVLMIVLAFVTLTSISPCELT